MILFTKVSFFAALIVDACFAHWDFKYNDSAVILGEEDNSQTCYTYIFQNGM